MFHPAFSFYMRASLLAWEAQQVIALRMMRFALGGAPAQRELQRMMTEKSLAAFQIGTTAWLGLASGRSGEAVAKTAVSGYSRRVRANRRRLTKG